MGLYYNTPFVNVGGQQPLTPRKLTPVINLFTVTVDAGGNIEVLSGSRTDWSGQVEGLAAVRIDSAFQIESVAASFADAAFSDEILRGVITADGSAAIEIFRGVRADGAGQVEWLSQAFVDRGSPLEVLTSSRTDAVFPFETMGAARGDVGAQAEWARSLKADAAPAIEGLAGVAVDAASRDETLSGVRVDQGVQAEVLSSVIALIADAAIRLEFLAVSRSSSAGQAETTGAVASNTPSLSEWGAAGVKDASGAVESNASARTDASAQLEALATTAVIASAAALIEFVKGTSTGAAGPLESLASMVATIADSAFQFEFSRRSPRFLNLHGLASQVISAINPPITLVIQHSTGYTTAPDGKRAPTYAEPIRAPGQVQPLTYNEIQHLDSLNIQGTKRAIYLYGHIDGLVRSRVKGGDLIRFPDDSFWLVVVVLEQWPAWSKCAVVLQNGS